MNNLLATFCLHFTRTYRMAGKFGGNLIWRIGLQFHLADFNLAVLFLRAMMSYVIVTQRVRNQNALPSSNVRSRCRSANQGANMEAELCVESCVRGHHVFKRTWTPSVGEQLSCK